MNKLNFFTPICYKKDSRTTKEFWIEQVDSYFYLKGKQAKVLSAQLHHGNTREVQLIDGNPSLLATVAKVVSYCTVIIPLIMLVAKAILRSGYNFYYTDNPPLLQTAPQPTGQNQSTNSHIQSNNLSKKFLSSKPAEIPDGIIPVSSKGVPENSISKRGQYPEKIDSEQTKPIYRRGLGTLKKLQPEKLEEQSLPAAAKIQSISPIRPAKAKAEKSAHLLSDSLLEQRSSAATKIQTACREPLARLDLEKLKQENLEEQSLPPAAKIQSISPSHLAKIKDDAEESPHCLSNSLFEKAKPYVDKPSNRAALPQVLHGKTQVYLPKELPIVLKRSDFPANRKRVTQMQQAHEICKRNNYECLVVPSARAYGNFIIESRLPITMHGTKVQIGLYIENREKFTDAVKEFTGFLCQSSLHAITSERNLYRDLSEAPVGRYDTIALYLENARGKIGLVDLEKFSPERDTFKQEKWCFFKCKDVVHLFPHHLEDIMGVAKKFDPNIELYRKNLERERDKALQRFILVYEKHLDFVRNKDITLQNPIAFEKLTAGRIEQLKKIIKKEFLEKHTDIYFAGFLGKKPDETLTCFNEKVLPQILDAIYKLINDILEDNMKRNEAAITSTAQLLAIRTLVFNYQNDAYCHFEVSTSKSIEMFGFAGTDLSTFLNFLLDTIFKELNGKEIGYYNPMLGDSGFKCIFC